MVRGVQCGSPPRGGKLGAARVPADHEPCDFPGTHRDQPDPRRPKLTRFLSREEIGRLHEVLDQYEAKRPSSKAQADIIRLLLLTGCRVGEMVKLRWREVDGDTLELEDSKTGPRQVLLSPEARAIIAVGSTSAHLRSDTSLRRNPAQNSNARRRTCLPWKTCRLAVATSPCSIICGFGPTRRTRAPTCTGGATAPGGSPWT